MLTTAWKVPSGPSVDAKPASEGDTVPFRVSRVSHGICMPAGPVYCSLKHESNSREVVIHHTCLKAWDERALENSHDVDCCVVIRSRLRDGVAARTEAFGLC
jgi:hypothetical protein